MSVYFAPDYAQENGQALAQLGQSIGNIINPDQKEMQQLKIDMTDPVKAQALANLYQQNPDAVSKIPGMNNHILASLSGISQDPNYTANRQMGSNLTNTLQDPTLGPIAAQVKLGIGTPDERTVESNRAQAGSIDLQHQQALQQTFSQLDPDTQNTLLKGENFRDKLGMTPEQYAESQLQLKAHQDQAAFITQGDELVKSNPELLKNPQQIIDDFKSGKISFAQFASLQANPRYGSVITDLYKQDTQKTMLNAQMDRQNALDISRDQRNTATIEGAQDRANTRAQAAEKIAADRLKAAHQTNTRNNFNTNLLSTINAINGGGKNGKPAMNSDELQAAQFGLQSSLNDYYSTENLGTPPKVIIGQNGGNFLGMNKKPIVQIQGVNDKTPQTLTPDNEPSVFDIKKNTPSAANNSNNSNNSNILTPEVAKTQVSNWNSKTPEYRASIKASNPSVYQTMVSAGGNP